MDRSYFFALAWLATILNAGVASAVFLLVARGGGRWVRALAAACVVSAIVFLVTAPLFMAMRCGFFGLVGLAYLAIAVVPSALGVCLLAGGRSPSGLETLKNADAAARHAMSRPSLRLRRAVGAALLIPPIVCAYASIIAPYQLVLEQADVPLPRVAGGSSILPAPPIRIGVLADLQTDRAGNHERRAIEMLTEASPDLLLLPGDFFQTTRAGLHEHRDEFRDLLAALRARSGCFAVLGDVDRPRETGQLLAEAGIRLLVNEVATVEVDGLRIAIAGLELHATSAAARETMNRLNGAAADIRVVLSHRPDAVLMARPDDRIDLFVAGHTHGGQVVVPGFGPPITLTQVPRDIAAGGLGQVNGRSIYVSRGVGFERGLAPPIRLFCPPEVTLLTLRR